MTAAVDDGILDAARLESFRKLQREVAFEQRRVDPVARQAQQQHWKAVHKSLRPRRASRTHERASRSPLAIDGALQLGLRHRRTPLDVLAARLVVELLLRAAARAPVRPHATAPTRRDVVGGRPARLARLARAGALLVDGPRRDLLGDVLRTAVLLQTLPSRARTGVRASCSTRLGAWPSLLPWSSTWPSRRAPARPAPTGPAPRSEGPPRTPCATGPRRPSPGASCAGEDRHEQGPGGDDERRQHRVVRLRGTRSTCTGIGRRDSRTSHGKPTANAATAIANPIAMGATDTSTPTATARGTRARCAANHEVAVRRVSARPSRPGSADPPVRVRTVIWMVAPFCPVQVQ